MKFRVFIREPQIMKEFQNIILTLSKLSKECIMTITEKYIHFIINEESSSSAPLVWIEIDCASYFDEYRMVGLNDKYPNILLSLNPSNMARAIQLLRNPVTYLKIKLADKQFPCLTIEIEFPSSTTMENRLIIHDVPVNIVPICDWPIYKLPNLPKFSIAIIMPNYRFLRNLIDKIKNFSPTVTFCMTNNGELSIISETGQATFASHYSHLEVKNFDSTNDINDDDDDNNKQLELSCSVDCKKTALFLSSLQFLNLELCFCIMQDHIIKIEITFMSGMKMNCVIPAVCI